ncbi:Fructosamine-3-kinase [Alteribacillus persepolensis]|uniref:Fructosamine-3-kinase n=1 Tax=Alteribacillus persepolensis TaxID=568899 RepID=A0A1G7ZQ99_9BACI|nr:fructosamine kinase family protein [Alteribacillus persepolensis]SDH10874.1 Fructosamine-3-kinase [Alteribacillus persepolensis]
MNAVIEEIFRQAEIHEEIGQVEPVAGGDISAAYLVHTKKHVYFVKHHDEAPRDFFRQEAAGLCFLGEERLLKVPAVYGWGDTWIVMEAVRGSAAPQTEEELGRGIAQLHDTKGTFFGLEEDNFIGELPQVNGWEGSWTRFLRDKRLKPQIELAKSLGRLPLKREKKAYSLLDHLHDYIPDHRHPVKLHGDLWGGNWISGENGVPCLIDPAVFYGDHEFELAFMQLFGGFTSAVFHAYEEIKPIDALFKDRKPLYQLYYLLVHLNMFGESYGGAVDRILKRYAKT